MFTVFFYSTWNQQQRNPSPSLSDEREGNLSEIVLQNELKVVRKQENQLTSIYRSNSSLLYTLVRVSVQLFICSSCQVEQLTQDWSESWRDKKELLEQYNVDINRDRAGFLINSLQPHLVSLDRDVLSTGVIFYHLRV